MTSLLGPLADAEAAGAPAEPQAEARQQSADSAEECENAVHDGYDADPDGRLPCSMPVPASGG